MPKTPRLSDLQLVLLSHAARNDRSTLHPLPTAALEDQPRTNKALAALLRRGLVVEREVRDPVHSWRIDHHQPIGLVLTQAGRAAISLDEGNEGRPPNGVEHSGKMAPSPSPTAPSSPSPSPASPGQACRPTSKIASVIALLQRTEGATLAEITDTTGWQAHSARAALTGLKKKGHTISKTKRCDMTCYHIAAEG